LKLIKFLESFFRRNICSQSSRNEAKENYEERVFEIFIVEQSLWGSKDDLSLCFLSVL
jgi:hypothetical protein